MAENTPLPHVLSKLAFYKDLEVKGGVRVLAKDAADFLTGNIDSVNRISADDLLDTKELGELLGIFTIIDESVDINRKRANSLPEMPGVLAHPAVASVDNVQPLTLKLLRMDPDGQPVVQVSSVNDFKNTVRNRVADSDSNKDGILSDEEIQNLRIKMQLIGAVLDRQYKEQLRSLPLTPPAKPDQSPPRKNHGLEV